MENSVYIDLDGTLIDVLPRYFQILKDYFYNEFNKELPISYENYIIDKRNRVKDHIIIQKCSAEQVNVADYINYKHTVLESKKYLELDSLFYNVHAGLKLLKSAGYHLVLLTQRNIKENVYWELEHLDLNSYFDEIIVVKPIFENTENAKIQYLNGIVKSSDLIIGDSPIEVQCSVNYGIKGYFVDCGLFNRQNLNNSRVYSSFWEACNAIVKSV